MTDVAALQQSGLVGWLTQCSQQWGQIPLPSPACPDRMGTLSRVQSLF